MPRPKAPGGPLRGGSASMKKAGRKIVVCYVTEAEHLAIRVAAAKAGQPMGHFVRAAALRAAQKNSEKNGNRG